jgi:hypothetical protein
MSKNESSKIYMGLVQRSIKQIIVDTLYINSASRILGRTLTEFEEIELRKGEIIFVKSRENIWFSFVAKTYSFPNDFVPSWVNFQEETPGNYFEEYFGESNDFDPPRLNFQEETTGAFFEEHVGDSND